MMKEVNLGQATKITSPNPLVMVCTEKENGKVNIAPVSFFMYVSFNPAMISFAMMKGSNSGENFRRTKKAVLAVPGENLKDVIMAYGSTTGSKVDKLEANPIPLQSMEGCGIQFPKDSRIAFKVTLNQTVEAGDHYLYTCNIDKIVADEEKDGLFAWEGYGVVAPAQRKA